MNLRTLAALALLGCLAMIGQAAPVSPPVTTSLRERQAVEMQWERLDALMKSIPQEPGATWSASPDYRFWLEYTQRLVFSEGVQLWDQISKDDGRRWQWLEFVSAYPNRPQFSSLDSLWRARAGEKGNSMADQAGRLDWERQLAAFKAECIASAIAPGELRAQLRCEALNERIRPYYQGAKPAAECDWVAVGREAAAIAADFPEYAENELRNLITITLRASKRHGPKDQPATLLALWAASPNAMVRKVASSEHHLADARVNPLTMSFTAVDGREVDLAKLRGKVVLIVFWAATWCGACKVQEPLMKEVYSKYHAQGFEIIGIACEMKEKDRQYLIDYVKEHAMPWPQFFDGRGMKNEFTQRYGFSSIPQYFLLGPDGLMIAHTGGSGGLKHLEAVVRKHLGLAPAASGDESKVLGVP
ncbi:TlpA family protein disulfide reductase [Oleiharenicola lentus]|uniref:TlpA family protein disulfide reductase n=1 Tax=Oleiharenicola lentus TaxID=2508720 RepID=UPI003F671E17